MESTYPRRNLAMVTRINNNIPAFNASRQLSTTGNNLEKSLERLSSGLRINRASDDAAGLTISERQRSQINGLAQAIANSQDAIGLINTAEGALNETTSRLQRIRALAIQAANSGTQDPDAIQAAQDEIAQSIQEITRIGNDTQFSTLKLLDGSNAATAAVQAGSPNRGTSITEGPAVSTLTEGLHFLRITRTVTGTEVVGVGTDGTNNATATNTTGSTFDTGSYDLVVSNARAASARELSAMQLQVDGGVALSDANPLNTLVIVNSDGSTTAVDRLDTFTVTGTDSDGTVITSTSVAATSTGTTSLTTLLNAVNGAYSGATATSAGAAAGATGTIDMTDLANGTSSTTITITFNDNSASANTVFSSTVNNAGNWNDAVVSLGGGEAQSVITGQTVTLFGQESSNSLSPTPRMTLTIGALTEGTDTIAATQHQFTATLDGGNAVTFQNGDQSVQLTTGTAAGLPQGENLQIDLGPIIAVTGTGASNAQTVLISAVNNGLDFQIGANKGQRITVGVDDMRATAMGYIGGYTNSDGSSTAGTVADIDVTTQSGADRAIDIVDRALSQVSRERSYLGAVTNRMEATISNLGVAQENLTAAFSRIRDADIAVETTEFVRNQILLQAGTAILSQANIVPQIALELLG
jgi:flagellin